MTQCLNLIYIAIKFHYYILKGYLVMGCAKIVLRARVACRNQSMQTIIFDYQCDSVFSTAVKFQNNATRPQQPLPVLIIDIEKIILVYATFTYICSHRQKNLQISILWTETGSLAVLFNSAMLKIVYGNSLYQLF